MRHVVFIALVVSTLLCGVCCSTNAASGIGIKFIGEMDFLVTTASWNAFGLEAGLALDSLSEPSVFVYCGSGKAYVRVPESGLSLYAGAGGIGIDVSVVDVSVSALGLDVFGGIELSLSRYDLPLVFWVGLDWLSFRDITFSVPGLSFDIPFGVSGRTSHFGVRLEF